MSEAIGALAKGLAASGKQFGLGDAPCGLVLLYPGGAHQTVIIGEYQGEEREALRAALLEAAEEL